MQVFRILLAAMFAGLLVYTLLVVAQNGLAIGSAFFAGVSGMAWPGQFNLDFAGYLLLSAVWIAWRHQFRPAGIALGVLASLGGLLVFAPYLFIASVKAEGDVRTLLLGPDRAGAPA